MLHFYYAFLAVVIVLSSYVTLSLIRFLIITDERNSRRIVNLKEDDIKIREKFAGIHVTLLTILISLKEDSGYNLNVNSTNLSHITITPIETSLDQVILSSYLLSILLLIEYYFSLEQKRKNNFFALLISIFISLTFSLTLFHDTFSIGVTWIAICIVIFITLQTNKRFVDDTNG